MGASKINEQCKTTPHLRNVNIDPQLSGTVRHLLEGQGVEIIGSTDKADIKVLGIG